MALSGIFIFLGSIANTTNMLSPTFRKPFSTPANQTCAVFFFVHCLSPDVPSGRAMRTTIPSVIAVIV